MATTWRHARLAGLLLLLAAAASASAQPEDVSLPLPLRTQWTHGHGYCGETSVQAVAAMHGVWVGQGLARDLAGGEVLLGLDDSSPGAIERVLGQLGLDWTTWEADWPGANASAAASAAYRTAFLGWARAALLSGRVPIFGSRLAPADGGAQPDAEFDHIQAMLAWSPAASKGAHDSVAWSTNLGDAVNRSVAAPGFFAPLHGCPFAIEQGGCLSADTPVYAVAVGGLSDPGRLFKPLSLSISAWSDGTPPDQQPRASSNATAAYSLDIGACGSPGSEFAVFRFDGPSAFRGVSTGDQAASNPGSVAELNERCTRAGAKCSKQSLVVTSAGGTLDQRAFGPLPADSAVFFLCVATGSADVKPGPEPWQPPADNPGITPNNPGKPGPEPWQPPADNPGITPDDPGKPGPEPWQPPADNPGITPDDPGKPGPEPWQPPADNPGITPDDPGKPGPQPWQPPADNPGITPNDPGKPGPEPWQPPADNPGITPDDPGKPGPEPWQPPADNPGITPDDPGKPGPEPWQPPADNPGITPDDPGTPPVVPDQPPVVQPPVSPLPFPPGTPVIVIPGLPGLPLPVPPYFLLPIAGQLIVPLPSMPGQVIIPVPAGAPGGAWLPLPGQPWGAPPLVLQPGQPVLLQPGMALQLTPGTPVAVLPGQVVQQAPQAAPPQVVLAEGAPVVQVLPGQAVPGQPQLVLASQAVTVLPAGRQHALVPLAAPPQQLVLLPAARRRRVGRRVLSLP